LKFAEQVFGLPPVGPATLGFTDTRATSIVDAFDFTQRPRAFTAIASRYPASHFRSERPSYVPPDDL
jgi:hypothetical protein